jgi:long-chain acyl-CoA synthetase
MISLSFDELIKEGYNNFKDITGIYEKIDGRYIGKTFGEFYSDVRSLSKKLLDMGLNGKNIILYGRNSYNWMVAYLAVTTYVGVVVPIDKEWKRNDINNVVSSLNISYIFHSGYLAENLEDSLLSKINLENETSGLILQGQKLDIKLEARNQDRVCAVFFTSGTTSAPKKVELTEKNFFANSYAMAELVSISTSDRYMVSLPLSHIGTVFGSFGCPIAMGASLYIPNDFKEIAEDLKLIRPTVLYGVPRIFEKLWETISADSKVKRAIKVSNFLRKIGIDMRNRFFAELHSSLGGEVRFSYNGAAKLDDKLIHIYNDMGLVIMQAYGMTETTAIVSCDSIKDYR